jgi:hypothetical protein
VGLLVGGACKARSLGHGGGQEMLARGRLRTDLASGSESALVVGPSGGRVLCGVNAWKELDLFVPRRTATKNTTEIWSEILRFFPM